MIQLGGYVRSKIVCTIGPASWSPDALRRLAEEGMDVARINLSHGSLAEHREVIRSIRKTPGVAVLVDVPGPKIRLGVFPQPVRLNAEDVVTFTVEDVPGNEKVLPVTYEKLPQEVHEGGRVYISDGLIELRVLEVAGDTRGFTARVVNGGEVSSHKGINTPGARLSVRPPTEQDVEGIRFGVEEGADWFAASFIRDRGDVERVKAAIRESGGDQPLISKVEHGEAIRNIDEIIAASDAVMVARGDLGIEIPDWEVPLFQKRIIAKCNEAGKPVIVATQMLESMILNPRPTRAEASDVANALLDGADAVMLSAETATGSYPVEAVRVMESISRAVGADAPRRRSEQRLREGAPIPETIGSLAARAVDAVKPAAIIVFTRSGFSGLMVSKHRPRCRILAVSRSPRVLGWMRLVWGVEPLDAQWTDDRDEMITRSIVRAMEKRYLKREDTVMVVSGSTLEAPGRTSTLEILRVGDVLEYASRRD